MPNNGFYPPSPSPVQDPPFYRPLPHEQFNNSGIIQNGGEMVDNSQYLEQHDQQKLQKQSTDQSTDQT